MKTVYHSLVMFLSSEKSYKIRWFCYWRNSEMSTTEIKFLSTVLESRFYSRYVLRLASPCEIRYVVLFYVLKRKRANASDNWSAFPLISSLVINIKCSDICYLRWAGRFLVEVNFPHCKANFVFSRRLTLGREPGLVQNRRYLGSSLLRSKIKHKLQF